MVAEAAETEAGTLRYKMFSILRLLLKNGKRLVTMLQEDVKVVVDIEWMRVSLLEVEYVLVLALVEVGALRQVHTLGRTLNREGSEANGSCV